MYIHTQKITQIYITKLDTPINGDLYKPTKVVLTIDGLSKSIEIPVLDKNQDYSTSGVTYESNNNQKGGIISTSKDSINTPPLASCYSDPKNPRYAKGTGELFASWYAAGDSLTVKFHPENTHKNSTNIISDFRLSEHSFKKEEYQYLTPKIAQGIYIVE